MDPFAAPEHVVAEYIMTGQPDAAIEHGQLAAALADNRGAAAGQMQFGTLFTTQASLRIHHQSPVDHAAIFVAEADMVQ